MFHTGKTDLCWQPNKDINTLLLFIQTWFPSTLDHYSPASHACGPNHTNMLFFTILRRKIVQDDLAILLCLVW